jgi:hypothetical protein
MNSSIPDESNAAIAAVFAGYSGKKAALIAEAVKSLIKNRRVLERIISAITTSLHYDRHNMLLITRSIIEVLALDPILINLRVRLAAQILPASELASFVTQIIQKNELHPEALIEASASVMARSNYDYYDDSDLEEEYSELEKIETLFARSNDERLRRLALSALIAQSKSTSGWNETKRSRLLNYRRD